MGQGNVGSGRSHHFIANRWGNNANSDRLYFGGGLRQLPFRITWAAAKKIPRPACFPPATIEIRIGAWGWGISIFQSSLWKANAQPELDLGHSWDCFPSAGSSTPLPSFWAWLSGSILAHLAKLPKMSVGALSSHECHCCFPE